MTYGQNKYIILTQYNETRRVEANSTLYVCIWEMMHLAKIEEKVEKLISSKIEELGYELYDIEYVKERKRLFLKNIYRQKRRNIFRRLRKSVKWNKQSLR